MRVAVYAIRGGKRARHIAAAMAEGLARHRVKTRMRTNFHGVEADVAVAYGWIHESVFRAYLARGHHYAYWDLGYFMRRLPGSKVEGYHRLATDDWDTGAHMMRGCPDDRFRRLGLRLKPDNHGGREVLIAGMSQKAARTHGYGMGQWEERTRREIAEMKLKYPVIVRPKTTRKTKAHPPIEAALRTARILVTHHSNCALDAAVEGVPFHAVKGVGALACAKHLRRDTILKPRHLSERDRIKLLSDAAYAQWTPAEMRSGEAWEHIRRLLCV